MGMIRKRRIVREKAALIDMKQVSMAVPNLDKSSKFKYIIVNKANESQYYDLIFFTFRWFTSSNT